MFKGRFLCKVSLLILLLALISTYAPWDLLGAYDKASVVERSLSTGDQIVAEGTVYHKELKNDKVVYYLKNATVKKGSKILKNISCIFKIDSEEIPNNCKVNIVGKVKLFSVATNEGGFDTKVYYNSLGLLFEIEDVKLSGLSAGIFSREDFSYRIRQYFLKVYESYLHGEEAGFLASVVIGERGNLDNCLKELFQSVGIAHILAVSGLHVSVVCIALYNLLRKRGFSFFTSGIVSGFVAIMYGCVTGGSISSIRAIGMFLIYLGSQIAGESYDMLTALAVMSIFLLLENPLYVKNGSFILSFGAILGIYYVVLPISRIYGDYTRERRKQKAGKIKEYIVSSFIFSLGMTIAMLPLVTQLYYQTPIYSVFVNIVVLPLMPILLLAGLVSGVLGMIYLPLAKWPLFICHEIIYFFEMISDNASKLPGASLIVGHRTWREVIFYYVCVVIIVHYHEKIIRLAKVIKEVVANRNAIGEKTNLITNIQRVEETLLQRESKDKKEILITQKKQIVIIVSLLIMIFIIWLIPRTGSFEIDILDVGQGDGIYINSGDGIHFFIDGGSTSSKEVGEYTILPFLKYKGVRSIDYWFVSHTDEDHISGLISLLESKYSIKNIVFTEYIPKEDNEALANIMNLAKENKTKVLYMKQGDIVGTKHISLKCVYPTEKNANLYRDNVNALSLSLLLSYDSNMDGKREYTAFFGGDIASEQEQIIVQSGLVEHVNLLKVSHHGSRYSSDSKFLKELSPDIAVISCAKQNRYGHPADEAVSRLEKSGAQIMYTMNSGRIRVDSRGVNLFLEDKDLL